jgi:hypothetical protein
MSYLPADLHDRLLEADGHRCAYWPYDARESERAAANTGQPMTVDHICSQAQD